MNSKELNSCIAKAFNNFGYGVTLKENFVFFESLNLEITGEIETENTIEEPSNYRSFIKIFLCCKSKTDKPIYEFTYGWGETKEESVVVAFERWIESDFPVIHDWISDHKIHDYYQDFEIRSVVLETYEELYFKGIVGPLSHYKGAEIFFDSENQDKLLIELNNDLTTDFLDKKGIYPIKCFLSNDENNKIQIDCRINGEVWERGYNTLFEYCKNWNVQTHTFWKQYIIIYSVDTIENKTKLDKITSEAILNAFEEDKSNPTSKKWWEFWK